MSAKQEAPSVESLMAKLTELDQAHARMVVALTPIRAAAVHTQGAASVTGRSETVIFSTSSSSQTPAQGTAPVTVKSEAPTVFTSSDSQTPAVDAISNPGYGVFASGTSGKDANGNLVSGVGVYANGISANSISGIGVYASGTSGLDTSGNVIPGVGLYGTNDSLDASGNIASNYGHGIHAIGTSGKDASGNLLPGVGVYTRIAHLDANGNLVPDYGHGLYAVGSSTKDANGNLLPGYGVYATSDNAVGVYGQSDNGGIGVHGKTATGTGVFGESANGNGVHGITSSSSDSAVYGEHTGTGIGIFARGGTQGGPNAHGVWGESVGAHGVLGKGSNAGVVGINSNNNNAAYLASQCCAAWFTGDVHITGNLSKGGGQFLIDYPLDPANKFLSHAFVESSEMKNVYDGVVVLDEHGETVVELPTWFEPLNTDFRYQLTSIGAPGPNLYIAEEIANRCFKVAGGTPMLKVCWQVTGVRQDAWAKAHPFQVESEKSAEERGYYLNPELYGASREQSIEFVRHPKMM